jgi:hypothetical protein
MAPTKLASALMATFFWAFIFALLSAGTNIPARMAMIEMTTNNSMSVNAAARGRECRMANDEYT